MTVWGDRASAGTPDPVSSGLWPFLDDTVSLAEFGGDATTVTVSRPVLIPTAGDRVGTFPVAGLIVPTSDPGAPAAQTVAHLTYDTPGGTVTERQHLLEALAALVAAAPCTTIAPQQRSAGPLVAEVEGLFGP